MGDFKLNEENYYSKEANLNYFSVSQFKDFCKCQAYAMAKLNGEYKEEKTEALMLGSFIDEIFTGNVEQFIKENQSTICLKSGAFRAKYSEALETADKISQQPLMMKYLSGEHQTIMVGEIAGVPFKIKMDSYKPGEFICDLKYMKTLKSPNLFESMIKYWGYDIQAACYQEIVYQNTGKRLPFIFTVATKENPPHLEVGEISQFDIDNILKEVKNDLPFFQKIKKGKIGPERCEEYSCDYCTTTRIIDKPIDVNMFGLARKEVEY